MSVGPFGEVPVGGAEPSESFSSPGPFAGQPHLRSAFIALGVRGASARKGLLRHHPRKGKPVARLGRKAKGRSPTIAFAWCQRPVAGCRRDGCCRPRGRHEFRSFGVLARLIAHVFRLGLNDGVAQAHRDSDRSPGRRRGPDIGSN